MKTYKGGIHWATAGDSHGECLIGIIYGLPPGWKFEPSLANHLLAERSKGFGRSQRQSFENDTIEVIGGLWKGKTVGSPLLFLSTDIPSGFSDPVVIPASSRATLFARYTFLSNRRTNTGRS